MTDDHNYAELRQPRDSQDQLLMSEDSSSDDEWCAFTKTQTGNAHVQAKCWECGKKFRNITNLMSHYKSHNISAPCHICNVTFRRLTSLSTHLDNAHSPPLCRKCHQSFSNVWELNKHAESLCLGSVPFQEASSVTSAVIYRSQNSDTLANEMTAQQSAATVLHDSESESMHQERLEMRPATSENSVEYIVGEDDKDIDMESPYDTGWDEADDSTSSDTDFEDETHTQPADVCPDDPESDGGSDSSATDHSSDSNNNTHSKITPATLPNVGSSVCPACDRGPFRSLKLHLLHCSGIRVKYQCSLCKMLFPTETSLNQHYMPLYSCDICGQVFSHENLYNHHQCPKGDKSPFVFFCSELMPKVCNICRAFFTSEKTLLNHVTRIHTSVVSTKLCIITNPPELTNKKVSPGVSGTAARSSTSSATCQNPNTVKQAVNGNLSVRQTYAGSLTSLKSSSSNTDRPHVPICMTSAAAPVRLGQGKLCYPTRGNSSQLTNQPATNRTPVSPPIPTIMAMFENDSHDVALMKRMNTGWRSKVPYPCRHCGAILRQPFFIISHRYLHRGRRSHWCQCGRAFKHRLHLLRHCVEHAEAISYICVNCGESFTGAKLLAEHMKGKSRKKSSSSGSTWKSRVKRKCKMPFTCDCGQLFFRPSAYIWHQLKNNTKTKQWNKPLK
ncbi:hypothetical protein PAMA_014986 [Pampus argenteus]